jgi:cephalosporin hydroxylase
MTIVSGDDKHTSPGLAGMDKVTFRGRTIVGWMPDNVRATLAMLIDRFEVRSVIEVGSFVGLSACFFAELVDEVVCVDRFDRKISQFAADAMDIELASHHELFLQNTAAYDNISSIKADSLEAAAMDITAADLVFIDASHEYEDVKADTEAWTPHAIKVICGDDNRPNWPGIMAYAREIGADVSERVWWFPIE